MPIVYEVTNKRNGKVFVSTTDSFGGVEDCRKNLSNSRHVNDKLQRDWYIHGEANFDFDIVAETTDDELDKERQRRLDRFVKVDSGGNRYVDQLVCYNLSANPIARKPKCVVEKVVRGGSNPDVSIEDIVFRVMLSRSSRKGKVAISQKTISEICDLSIANVGKAIKLLKQAQRLRVVQKAFRGKWPTRYEVIGAVKPKKVTK